MNIIPAIDLKSGQCVRLYQGHFDKVQTYSIDPVSVAVAYAAQGAKFLHIVDLDGAKQESVAQTELIKKMSLESGILIQTGGGIRSRDQIVGLLHSGIARVVIGSSAVSQVPLVKNWLKEFGSEKIVLALDVNLAEDGQPMLVTHAWQKDMQKTLWDLLAEYEDVAPKYVLCTDIKRDGTLNGPNIELYRQCLKRFPSIEWQASGGVSKVSDLCLLKKLDVSAAIIGKAFYENRFSFSEAEQAITSC